MISVIERDHSLIMEEIEQKHEAAERTEEEFIKDLGREMNEVRKRRSELKHLENTEDPLHLLQVRMAWKQPSFILSADHVVTVFLSERAKVHTSFTQLEVQILVFKNTLVKVEVLIKLQVKVKKFIQYFYFYQSIFKHEYLYF